MTTSLISPLAALLALQWTYFCSACNRECMHAVFGECGRGYAVECLGCGEKKVAEFTRMQTEER